MTAHERKVAAKQKALDKKVTKLFELLDDEDVFPVFMEKMGDVKGMENLVTCHKELKDVGDTDIIKYLTRTMSTSEMATVLINEMSPREKKDYIFDLLDQEGLSAMEPQDNRMTIASLLGLQQWATSEEITKELQSYIS